MHDNDTAPLGLDDCPYAREMCEMEDATAIIVHIADADARQAVADVLADDLADAVVLRSVETKAEKLARKRRQDVATFLGDYAGLETGIDPTEITWQSTSGRYCVTQPDGSSQMRDGHGADVATQAIDAAGFKGDATQMIYATDGGWLLDSDDGRWCRVETEVDALEREMRILEAEIYADALEREMRILEAEIYAA